MLLKCKCHLFCYWFAHRKYQKFNLCRKCYESHICKSFFIINIITERSTSKGRSRKTAFRKLVFWKNLIKRLFSRNLNQYQRFSSFAYINHLWLSILLHACLSVVVVFWRFVYRVLELFIECSANASPQSCQTSPALVIEEYNLLRCPCAWVIAVRSPVQLLWLLVRLWNGLPLPPVMQAEETPKCSISLSKTYN